MGPVPIRSLWRIRADGREDFKFLTFNSEKDGTITAQERGLIHSVIDFRNLNAQ